MNEDLKNIETCLPESILAEVASVPTDAQFRSLTDEALDPLKQQAAEQEGWDAYQEVVDQHQPYTFTSAVKEMKSNLILLLRRLWLYPFGTGSLRSLSDMWSHYITRLQGNETYGIPSRLDQLTDLPSAPLLVSDRKISDLGDCPDGISLAQILGNRNAPITEIKDTNHGWTWNRALPSIPLRKLVLGCKYRSEIFNTWNLQYLQSMKFPELVDVNYPSWPDGYNNTGIFNNMPALTELEMPKLEVVTVGSYGSFMSGMPLIRVLTLPSFREWRGTWNGGILFNMAGLEELYLPEFRYCGGGGAGRESFVLDCPELWKVVVGYGAFDTGTFTTILPRCPKVIHFEFINEVSSSQRLAGWNPSYVLSDNPTGTDLVEDPTAHPTWNNLQQFLQNFRDYIANRLTDNGSGKTLTLSQAVFSAVIEGASPICDDIKGIIEDKGWKVQDTNNNIFPTT